VTLKWGVYSGSFTVAKAGDEALQWTAAAKPFTFKTKVRWAGGIV
jgi:hypothetical protein